MEFTGLVKKYPVNRPLTPQERALQLHQKQPLPVEPHYQLSVIQLNSTFLESVDKWFGWKGAASMVTLVCLLMSVGFLGGMSVMILLEAAGVLPTRQDPAGLVATGAFMVVMALVCAAGFGWLLRHESFAYTHYPIRFNRRTRTVHVFRTDGTVLSVPWDAVFFTMGHLPQWNEWEVRGHVLGADGTTVKETFPLSYVGTFDPDQARAGQRNGEDFVRGHWEFIRRYMEDGPAAVSGQVQFCMPVDGRKETAATSIERIFANIAGAPTVLRWLLWPWCLLVAGGRLFAMRTSKIPAFPAAVEAQCAIEPGDPYAIRGDARGERVPVYAEAAALSSAPV